MNKKAKFGALLIALSLSAAACGSDGEATDAGTDETTTESSVVAEAEEAAEGEAMEEEAEGEAMEEEAEGEAMEEEAEGEAMEEEAMEDAGTIVDVATEAGSFNTLLAAAEAAGLVDTLNGEGPLTVFAPTDEAFATALASLDTSAEELLADTELLTSILTYHVVPGQVLSTDLSDGLTATTVNGADITVDLTDGVKINEANVVTPDIKASNGVVHVIDAVLIPS